MPLRRVREGMRPSAHRRASWEASGTETPAAAVVVVVLRQRHCEDNGQGRWGTQRPIAGGVTDAGALERERKDADDVVESEKEAEAGDTRALIQERMGSRDLVVEELPEKKSFLSTHDVTPRALLGDFGAV